MEKLLTLHHNYVNSAELEKVNRGKLNLKKENHCVNVLAKILKSRNPIALEHKKSRRMFNKICHQNQVS